MTGVFALVGTHEQPFDRLVRALDELPGDEPRFVQTGYSTVAPERAESAQFLPFDEVRRRMTDADVVVTHAGTGSVMLALSLGKIPIVAPRYARLGEHVDDHQHQLVEALVESGLVVPWREGESLADRVAEVRSRAQGGRKIEPDPRLVADLRAIIESD